MRQLIPRDFIDTVISRNDIVEVISSYVPLKKRGQNYLACCPFHSENTPSFNVRQAKQYYHCFGCGASGNVISFLMEYDHMEFVESIQFLAQRAGLTLPQMVSSEQNTSSQHQEQYALLQQASTYYQQQLREHPDALRVIQYLKNRGLSGEIAKRFQLGFAPPGWDNLTKQFSKHKNKLIDCGLAITKESGGCYDRFRDRVMFPIRDRRGRVIGFGGRVLNDEKPKYLNSPETAVFHKSNALYGIFEALQDSQKIDSFVIVEGYMDVVALAQFGITSAVATLGTATSPEHLRVLLRYTDKLIFCFDGDSAGRKAATRALEMSLTCLRDGITIQFLFLPEKDDPDSFIREQGVEAWHARCNNAQNLVDFFFAHLQLQADCQTVEGRTAFIKLASPLLKTTAKCLLRDLIIERMSRLLRIDLERLLGMLELQSEVTKPTKRKMQRLPNRVELALALLIQFPELARHLQDYPNITLNTSDQTAQLWKEISAMLQANPTLSTGALLEAWRNHPLFSTVVELANVSHTVPLEGIDAEFTGLLAGLARDHHASTVQHLMQLAASGQITDDQKIELQQAIKLSKIPQ